MWSSKCDLKILSETLISEPKDVNLSVNGHKTKYLVVGTKQTHIEYIPFYFLVYILFRAIPFLNWSIRSNNIPKTTRENRNKI